MKDTYFDNLKNVLIENNINDSESIIQKYLMWYDAGIKLGITHDEIIDKFGTPQSIVEEYLRLYENLKGDFNFLIKTYQDNIDILYSIDEKTNVLVKNIDQTAYNVVKTDKLLKIEYIDNKLDKRRKPGNIRIELPISKKLNNVFLSTVSGEINVFSINSHRTLVETVDGDIFIDEIKSIEMKITSDVGKIFGTNYKCQKCILSTVSSNIHIESLDADISKVETISGNIYVDSLKGVIAAKSMSGDIIINNEPKESSTKFYVSKIFNNY